ncbi:MAG: ATP-binding protein [Calditrichia bacterium]|nr:ATP-binding protein [Calditrichia bacterium]
MKRELEKIVCNDLKKKMVFITGPRQVGKTWLAKQIMSSYKSPQYLNYDVEEDRTIILKRAWKPECDLLIFDEIHKMKNWKIYLKGIFDSREEGQAILITGSARMETFRQSGESLAGRYFHHQLLPFSVKEIVEQSTPYAILEKLNRSGGFPEPYLNTQHNDDTYAARWRKQYYTDLIREDILEFSRINEIKTMRILLELLRKRVGSPLSLNSLAEDLDISYHTVKKYITILESLYIVFLVHPYHSNIARAIKKEPKLYFYDSGFVIGNKGIRLENSCAVSLLKHTLHLSNAFGKNINLRYMRTKDGKEIDFAIIEDGKPKQLIEVKLTDTTPSSNLNFFLKKTSGAESIQLVHNIRQEMFIKNIMILNASKWLAGLSA